ncbi:MAG TPA: dihydrodipicolinate synthase family protein [Ktedonobacteraceae bacterium]|jgi:4-hydroxy-2-oxoglutarate aldolase|nr:dihydrodipicolinate synthase family protein [Ktedonobacteraceae bacterium]
MANTFTLPDGIYPPLPTFFDAQEELDLATFRRHIQNLAQTGIAGYVVMGSNGEAPHLTAGERTQLIQTARSTAGETIPILAGCGEQSTHATITHCHLAARAGADVALVLPPFYFKNRMDSQALLAHYRTIADASPLPIVIYNMPANTAGIDLDAALVCTLAEHPNIIGIKDSAGNIAKLAQIVAQAPAHFRVFAGSAGYLLPALTVGAVGAVAALANIFPREVCQVQALFNAGKLVEARRLQARLVPANTAVTTIYNVPGLKAALELTAGYGGRPRSPLQPLTPSERDRLAQILQAIQLHT